MIPVLDRWLCLQSPESYRQLWCAGVRRQRLGFELTTSITSENYSRDDFRQLVVTIEATPAFLGGLGELEDHRERSLIERHPFERTVR